MGYMSSNGSATCVMLYVNKCPAFNGAFVQVANYHQSGNYAICALAFMPALYVEWRIDGITHVVFAKFSSNTFDRLI